MIGVLTTAYAVAASFALRVVLDRARRKATLELV
jgi:hypothetical protein